MRWLFKSVNKTECQTGLIQSMTKAESVSALDCKAITANVLKILSRYCAMQLNALFDQHLDHGIDEIDQVVFGSGDFLRESSKSSVMYRKIKRLHGKVIGHGILDSFMSGFRKNGKLKPLIHRHTTK